MWLEAPPEGCGGSREVFREPKERRKEGRSRRRPWGAGPSSRVPLPHPRPYSGARERKGRRVAGELAAAPGHTEEISLSLCLSACEPPPGPLLSQASPLFSLPPRLNVSLSPPPGPPASPLRGGKALSSSLALPALSPAQFQTASVPPAALPLAGGRAGWGVPSMPCPSAGGTQHVKRQTEL